MKRKNIITGIDIGTTKIIAIIAEMITDDELDIFETKILGIGEHPSNGLKKGVVVDVEETIRSLEKAINSAEEKAECEINDVYVGITGDHIKGMNYKGKIRINNTSQSTGIGHEITQKHINAALDRAKSINVPPGMRILHTLSQSFEVDDRRGIHNPIGLSGNTLGVNVHLVTSEINVEKDIETCFNKLGIKIIEFVLEPLASSYSVLDKNEKELGVALVDIGGGTTDVIVYYDGGIQYSSAISYAGNYITLDINRLFKTTWEQATELKHKHGIAKSILADTDLEIEVKGVRGRESIKITQKTLSEVIEDRMVEILTYANEEIVKSDYADKLSFGIVLTGGGSELRNIVDLAQDITSMPVQIGYPQLNNIQKLDSEKDLEEDSEKESEKNEKIIYDDNPRLATAIGIINYVAEKSKQGTDIEYTNPIINFLKLIKNKLTSWY